MMNNYLKILGGIALSLTLLTSGCQKIVDDIFDPKDELPPATQTGANKFGCLINGKVFIPSGPPLAGPSLNVSYMLYEGKYYLGINAHRGGGENSESIRIGALEIPEPLSEGTYPLTFIAPGNTFGEYELGLDGVSPTEEAPGTLTITRLDLEADVISGTFEFTVIHNGKEIAVTDGRFDMAL